MKTFFASVFVFLIVFGAGCVNAVNPVDQQPVENQNPSGRASIELYVKENISKLSPKKEVLGGKFFVTSFEANDGKGVVSYEDGHNAYTADFTYVMSFANNPEGEFTVTSFVVREDKPAVQPQKPATGSDQIACTKEYKPVCGFVPVVCITTPCNPVPQTFSNRCMAKAGGAVEIIEGVCKENQTYPPTK